MEGLVYAWLSRKVKSSNGHTHHLLDGRAPTRVCMRARMCTCVYEYVESILLTITSCAH